MRVTATTLSLVAWVLVIPTTAWAQATIAGAVRDTSGAALPGVSVEATSSALIEKVRAAVTDGTGQYRIEDLRPGTYTVTFSLQGFNSLKREGVELTGSFTATINAELSVGTLTETVVVTGESPIVDVQSARRQMTLSNDIVTSIPTVRSYNALLVLVPGVVSNNNDVQTGPLVTMFPIHGGRNVEGRMNVDGLNVGNPPGGNQPPNYLMDIGTAQEVTFTTSGGLGEAETAGLSMNIVPKTGGNSIQGSIYVSGSGEALLSDNFTPELEAAGLRAATPLTGLYDFSGSFGGPISRDRLWYFVNARTQGNERVNANQFYNLNAGDSTTWLYAPDYDRPGFSDRTFENVAGRLTWQATPRNKISVFWDEQWTCRNCEGTTTGLASPAQIVAPEADGVGALVPFRVQQATWSSPATNRLLLDAGFGTTYYGWGNFERDGAPTRDLIRVLEQCASGCAANGGIPGLTYRSQDWNANYTGQYTWRASASYVTGTHSLKIGYQGTYFTDERTAYTNNQHLQYRVSNGVPNQLTQSVSPFNARARASIAALYAQEQWTLGRLTLQGALRFDRAHGWFPPQQVGPSRFVPTAITFPETEGVDSYKDITPRMGAAFDVFGTGKTSVKVNLGKYLLGVSTGQPQATFYNTNPTLRLPNTSTIFGVPGVQRSWTDANGDFNPDCDLLNPLAQDLRAGGGDFCGQISNLRFGQPVLTGNFDPDILDGWRIRPSDWSFGVSVQQQILPRASVEVGYYRRWFNIFHVNDNLAVRASDYTAYSITAPLDPHLPGGGGYTVSGLYDVDPAKFGQIDNLTTFASNFGEWYEHFNGVDITLNVRTQGGLTFQGGTSTGQSVADTCDVRANLPELVAAIGGGNNTTPVNTTTPYCHHASGFLTQFRGLASYIVPRIDVQVSGVYQNKPGPMLAANYAVPSAVVAQSLGRPPAGNVPNVTVNLLEPGELYGDRIGQLDLRVAKILRFRRTRTTVGLDVYNALNASTVLVYNSTFVPGGTWQQPRSIITGRLIRIGGEMSF
jgi:Carboxypeptidase regulatory-like domain